MTHLALEERRAELLHHAPAVLAERFRRALTSCATDGVAHREVLGKRDALAQRAAEQLVDRHAGELPADVPQRHLDRAIGTDRIEAVGVVQRLHGRNGRSPAGVEVGGAAPEQSRRKLLPDQRRMAPVTRLADSGDAGARLDLDDDLRAAEIEARDPAVGGDERKVDLRRADRGDRHDGRRVVFGARGPRRRTHRVTARSAARGLAAKEPTRKGQRASPAGLRRAPTHLRPQPPRTPQPAGRLVALTSAPSSQRARRAPRGADGGRLAVRHPRCTCAGAPLFELPARPAETSHVSAIWRPFPCRARAEKDSRGWSQKLTTR